MNSRKKANGNTSPVDNLHFWGVQMMRDKIIASCSAGRPFKIDGVGTWVPSPQPDGSVEVQFRPDETLINALNAPVIFDSLSEHSEKPVPPWITVLDPE